MPAEALHITNLSKTFPGQVALDRVDLAVGAGEVHALVGQNGSGKSTLIKILAGYHQPDPGPARAFAGGSALALGDGHAAARAGIRFVHQDLGLVGPMDAVENIALTAGYRTGRAARIRWRDEAERTRAALDVLGLAHIDVKAPVDSLPPSHRTAIAIARALVAWEDAAHLLILDEPTATLPGDDVQRLFDVVHRLKSRGVSILYVSHHLDEVFELADRVTVLRDGRKVVTTSVDELDHARLVELIVGHRIEASSASETVTDRSPTLRVRDLRGGNVHGIDLDVAPGEIVGVAGITGSGREHLLGLIGGQIARTGGEVVLDGTAIADFVPRQAIGAGVASVPAERALRGTFAPMNVRENLSICDVGRHFLRGRLRHRRERAETSDWIDSLAIKSSGTEALIGSLSGGNQQKVMFGKALRLAPKLLLLDEPTQGIDVGAKEQIHRLIDGCAVDGGAAVLVASTDTDELVRLCHRVVVLTGGRISAVLAGDDLSTERIEHTQLETSRRTP